MLKAFPKIPVGWPSFNWWAGYGLIRHFFVEATVWKRWWFFNIWALWVCALEMPARCMRIARSTHPRLPPIIRQLQHIGRRAVSRWAIHAHCHEIHVTRGRNAFHTDYITLRAQDRVDANGVASGEDVLKRIKARQFLGSIDLETLHHCTEQILNLPGALPFFPTKVTELSAG